MNAICPRDSKERPIKNRQFFPHFIVDAKKWTLAHLKQIQKQIENVLVTILIGLSLLSLICPKFIETRLTSVSETFLEQIHASILSHAWYNKYMNELILTLENDKLCPVLGWIIRWFWLKGSSSTSSIKTVTFLLKLPLLAPLIWQIRRASSRSCFSRSSDAVKINLPSMHFKPGAPGNKI